MIVSIYVIVDSLITGYNRFSSSDYDYDTTTKHEKFVYNGN